VQSIDQDIVAEGMWYYNLRNLNEHNLNQTINVLKNIAESTKRLDLLEYTRKLADTDFLPAMEGRGFPFRGLIAPTIDSGLHLLLGNGRTKCIMSI